MTESTLGERVAIVTGSGRGIGLAISRRLLDEGNRVVLADVDKEAVVRAAGKLGSGAEGVELDVTKQASIAALFSDVLAKYGRIDILVNNAGVAGQAAPVAEYEPAEWDRVLAVNLTGPFLCVRAAIPAMLSRGYGRIVNVASISGKEGNPNMSAYSSSKGGLITFTKAVAKELAGTGVLVNCVTPAVIQSEMLEQLTPEAVEYMVAKIPMGRVGQPEEVAALVAWLASDQCSFSTGAVFDISGGRATY